MLRSRSLRPARGRPPMGAPWRLLALLLCLAAGAAPAQEAGPEAARAEALVLLARDEGNVPALLAWGRAELALGDMEAALGAARRAHAEASTAAERFTAARLAAKANAEMRRWTRAQVWLRRARADAPNAEAVAALARDYRALRAANPLAVSLSFGVAPTSNVNGGTYSETILIPNPFGGGGYIPTIPDPRSRPLSGLRISGATTLAYRFRATERSTTALEAQVQGRTYILSEDAREDAPGIKGSEFSDLAFSESVVHRWRGERDSGPSSVRATLGRTWYDGEPYLRTGQLSYARTFVVAENDRIDLSPWVDWTERRRVSEVLLRDSSGRPVRDPATNELVYRDRALLDGFWSVGLRGSWNHRLPSGNHTSLSLALRHPLTDAADLSYRGATFGVGYDWDRPIRGARVGLATEIDWRSYELTRYAYGSREDVRATVRATIGLPRYDLYGFEPTVTVEASRTESDGDRFDKNALSVDLGFRSSF